MTIARDLMTESPARLNEADTVTFAARQMLELGVGALPIWGEDDRLHGMLTDRDIVLKVVAKGLDPGRINVGQLAQEQAVTVSADDPAERVLQVMAEHKVRRLPVIDNGDLVGLIAQADLARAVDTPQAGQLLAALSTD